VCLLASFFLINNYEDQYYFSYSNEHYIILIDYLLLVNVEFNIYEINMYISYLILSISNCIVIIDQIDVKPLISLNF
jgi:hypothetical protein